MQRIIIVVSKNQCLPAVLYETWQNPVALSWLSNWHIILVAGFEKALKSQFRSWKISTWHGSVLLCAWHHWFMVRSTPHNLAWGFGCHKNGKLQHVHTGRPELSRPLKLHLKASTDSNHSHYQVSRPGDTISDALHRCKSATWHEREGAVSHRHGLRQLPLFLLFSLSLFFQPINPPSRVFLEYT